MSENQQETAAEETGVPASPGHQGGPPPAGTQEPAADKIGEEAASSQPHKIEPRAGRDS
jgi:hypothetical protein